MVRRAFALAAGLCLAAASIVNAQPAPAAGQPPIVDRELYFGDPEISGAQLSPDGRFIAFLKPLKGTRNVWVKASAEPFDQARPITADAKRPIGSFFWSRDSRAVLFVQDQGGDENYNVYAVDPAAAPAAGAEVPTARNLTAAKNVRAFIYAVPKSEPDAIYVGLNDREPAWHDLYKVRISTGERQLLRKNTERLTGWAFDTRTGCASRRGRPRTATPKSCGSTNRRSRKSTRATCSRPARPCSSTRTARASTWSRTRAMAST